MALRAWIVLRSSEGVDNRRIATEFMVDEATVALWRRRFLVHRIAGILSDAPRSGRKPRIPAALVAKIASARSVGSFGAANSPTSRSVAREMRVSQSTVVRIWKTHDGPTSTDVSVDEDAPLPARPIRDVRGIYLCGEDRCVVLISQKDELASPIEPRDTGTRHSRGPLAVETPRRPPRDPLAAVRVIYRTILPEPGAHDRLGDFLLFLRGVEFHLGPNEIAHVLLETSLLGKDATLLRWLRRRPGFVLYLSSAGTAPGRASFDLPDGLTTQGVRPSSLRSLPKLIDAFRAFSVTSDRHPRPFVWTLPEVPASASIASHRPLAPRALSVTAHWLTPPIIGSGAKTLGGPIGVEPIVPSTSMAFLPIRAGLAGGFATRLEPLPIPRGPAPSSAPISEASTTILAGPSEGPSTSIALGAPSSPNPVDGRLRKTPTSSHSTTPREGTG